MDEGFWQALLQKQKMQKQVWSKVEELTGNVSNIHKVQEFALVANYLPDIDLYRSLSCQLAQYQQTVG